MLLPEKVILLNLLQYAGRLPEAVTLATSMGKKDIANRLMERWNELLLRDGENATAVKI